MFSYIDSLVFAGLRNDIMDTFEMNVLSPDPSALAEVIRVHETLDPPDQPLVLSSMQMSMIESEDNEGCTE